MPKVILGSWPRIRRAHERKRPLRDIYLPTHNHKYTRRSMHARTPHGSTETSQPAREQAIRHPSVHQCIPRSLDPCIPRSVHPSIRESRDLCIPRSVCPRICLPLPVPPPFPSSSQHAKRAAWPHRPTTTTHNNDDDDNDDDNRNDEAAMKAYRLCEFPTQYSVWERSFVRSFTVACGGYAP